MQYQGPRYVPTPPGTAPRDHSIVATASAAVDALGTSAIVGLFGGQAALVKAAVTFAATQAWARWTSPPETMWQRAKITVPEVLMVVVPLLGAAKTIKSLLSRNAVAEPTIAPPVAGGVTQDGPSRHDLVANILCALFIGLPTLLSRVENWATPSAKAPAWWNVVQRIRASRAEPASKAQRILEHVLRVSLVTRRVAEAYLLARLALWATSVLTLRWSTPIGAKWSTRLIMRTLLAPALSSSAKRNVFNNMPLVACRPRDNHTHGLSAAARNQGSATSALAAGQMGLEPYFVQQSLSDTRKGRDGDRSFHWAKDLAVPPKEFSFDAAHQAAILVDVDHYVNMPHLLAHHPGTYFICTFQPTESAVGSGEYSFRFREDGQVVYRVSGGAEYVHHVWDYSGDTLLVEDSGFLKKTVVAYHVDRKHIDAHHVVVMLTEIGQFTTMALVPTSLLLEGKPLKRLNPIFGKHVILDVMSKEGLKRSIANSGDFIAATLPMEQLGAVNAVALVAKVPITPAMVASNIAPSSPAGLPTERLPPGHAAIIAGYIRAGTPTFPPTVYPAVESMQTISFDKHDYDAPVPLAGFGSPLIGPCYGFSDSIASDNRCIEGRVEAFRNVERPPLPPIIGEYMREFAAFMIPVAHRGHPIGDDEVSERQTRPSQRSILEEAAVTGDNYKETWGSFVKKETYQKPTDPRNIAVSPPAIKLAYSRFMYAFSDDVMSDQAWYAFNRTPKEIAARVCGIMRRAGHAVLADGNRFDAHVAYFARVLERHLLLRHFAPEHHEALNEAMDEQIAMPGVSAHGRRFNSGLARLSGSLETSNLNSCLTAFTGYCAHRNTTVNGVRKNPAQAWADLGVYGGDDSLEGDVNPEELKKSAEIMGQDYEITVVLRGYRGVEFLNRQFGPDVWNGDPSSMSNPARLLSKLWVGPTSLKEPLVRFGERLSGYYRMDRNSPVIGEITRVGHELLGDFTEGELMPWAGDIDVDSNWPNEDSGWMMDCFKEFIEDFDFDRFRTWIAAVRASGDKELLLRAPLCTAAAETLPPVKVPMIIGDTLRDPSPKVSDTATPAPSLISKFPPTDPPMVEFEWEKAEQKYKEPSYVHPADRKANPGRVKLPKARSPKPRPGVQPPTAETFHAPPDWSERGANWVDKLLKANEQAKQEPAPTGTTAEALAESEARRVVVRIDGQVQLSGAEDDDEALDRAMELVKPGAKLAPKGKFKLEKKQRPVVAARAKAPAKASTKEPEFADPRTWEAPMKRKNESESDHKDRLAAWTAKRAKIAKKIGVSLTSPVPGAPKK